MMIMSLNVNYKCQSGRKCDRVGFYTIWYVRACKLRWWASPPQLDLLGSFSSYQSLHTREALMKKSSIGGKQYLDYL